MDCAVSGDRNKVTGASFTKLKLCRREIRAKLISSFTHANDVCILLIIRAVEETNESR